MARPNYVGDQSLTDPEVILEQARADVHRRRHRVQRIVQFVARVALIFIFGGLVWLASDLFTSVNFTGRVVVASGTAIMFIALFAAQAFMPKNRVLEKLLGIAGFTILGALYSYVRTHYST